MVAFNNPRDVSVMTDGRMIICDQHRVMLMYTNYHYHTSLGQSDRGAGIRTV